MHFIRSSTVVVYPPSGPLLHLLVVPTGQWRWGRFLGLSSKRVRRIADETIDWARELLEDGMPYAIAAETVGLNRRTLEHYLPGYKNHETWQDAWSQILNNPRLLKLHWEFNEYAPKS